MVRIGTGKLCKIAAVGVGIVVISSVIGPEKIGPPIIPEVKRVASVYSEEEIEQIERFKYSSQSILLARVAGKSFDFNNRFEGNRVAEWIINDMFNNYSEMSPRVRDEVRDEMKSNYSCFENSNDGVLLEFYKEKACELGLDFNSP